MKRRIYSDKFVEKQIAKIDEIFERNQIIVNYPRCMDYCDPSLFTGRKLAQYEIDEIKKYYKQLQELNFVRGFWHGYSIAHGIDFDKKEK